MLTYLGALSEADCSTTCTSLVMLQGDPADKRSSACVRETIIQQINYGFLNNKSNMCAASALASERVCIFVHMCE